MSTSVKLGLIGAGSAVFSLGLVRDICLRESLAGSRVVLMDVDLERLEVMHTFAERYAAELGADITFEMTAERARALKDADFVINTALVGGHSAYERVRDRCEERGYYRGLRIYTSREAHSSVIKGARVAGFGDENVVLVDIDSARAMDPADLPVGFRLAAFVSQAQHRMLRRKIVLRLRADLPAPAHAALLRSVSRCRSG